MPRALQNSSVRSSLPLALSLVVHACAFAALWHIAPLAPASERESEPVTVRLVPHSTPPEERLEPLRAADRRALPVEQDWPSIPSEPLDEEAGPEPGYSFANELPASAWRSVIGVGSSGALRLQRPRAPQAEDCAAPSVAVASVPAPMAEVTPPAPLDCPPPEYPAGAASVGERGRVRLEIRIGSDGSVESVGILHSSGFARLDEAALAGVRRWRFHPARRAGVAIAWRLEHTIVFRVDAAR
jgi:protein TonB